MAPRTKKPEKAPEASTAIAERRVLLEPMTGQMIYADDVPSVAAALDALKRHKQEVETAISVFADAVIAESKRVGKKTIEVGDYRLVVSPDTEVEWDLQELAKLREAGLPEERYNELVKIVVEEKVNAAVAKQIEGASEEYAMIIGAARRRVPKRQYVKVST